MKLEILQYYEKCDPKNIVLKKVMSEVGFEPTPRELDCELL